MQGLKVGDAVSTIPAYSQNQYGVYGDAANCAGVRSRQTSAVALVGRSGRRLDAICHGLRSVGRSGRAEFRRHAAHPGRVKQRRTRRDPDCGMIGAVPVALTRRSNKPGHCWNRAQCHVIATEEQDLVAEVQKLTGGKGSRVAFDPVGGPTIAKLAAAMAKHGMIIEYGALRPRPNTATALRIARQIVDDQRLRSVRDHGRTGEARTNEEVHRRRLVGRQAQACHRQDISARSDRSRTPMSSHFTASAGSRKAPPVMKMSSLPPTGMHGAEKQSPHGHRNVGGDHAAARTAPRGSDGAPLARSR